MDKIILIADGWGRTAGGINSFNYSLCKTMGTMYGRDIVCVVPEVGYKECKRVEKEYGMKLVSVVKEDCYSAEAIVSILREDKILERKTGTIIWIGHDIITGEIALDCKARWQGSKSAIIHHMAYNEYYSLLSDDPMVSLQKEEKQRKILRQADFVFTNGPKLKNSAINLVGSAGEGKILEILPGLEKISSFSNNSKTFSIVTFGRVEKENNHKKSNSIIKQTNLAVAAWASFAGSCNIGTTNMDVIGYDETACDMKEENSLIKSFVEEYAGRMLTVRAIPYVRDSQILFQKISEKSLCLMLSKEEGFGLSGLEAISAGVPVIISKSTGLYQALEERRLENYILAVEIEGKSEAPFFTDNDLKNVKKAIAEIYDSMQKYKNDVLDLRKELMANGFSWEESVSKMVSFMNADMTIRKNSGEILYESRIVTCREKFGREKWFDRYDLYEQIDSQYAGQRVIFVDGFERSGKVISLVWWAKSKGIRDEQMFYYEACEDENPEYFKALVEGFWDSSIVSEEAVYLLVDDFPMINAQAYYKAMILLMDRFPNLMFIVFSDHRINKLSEIRKFYDYVRISVEGLSISNVKDYFALYGITIQEEKIEALADTEYLPVILKKYVDYVLDKNVDIEEAIQKTDIDKELPERTVRDLKEEEKILGGVLALFEIPFSKKIASQMAQDFEISPKILEGLADKRIIIQNSEYSYKVPKFYKKCLREMLSEENKNKGYLEISRYYYYAYRYEWGSNLTNEDVIRGMYACEFALKAQKYEKVKEYLLRKKYAIWGKAMKLGLYQSLIAISEVLYDRFQNDDGWLVYNLAHCLIITGKIPQANGILTKIELEDIQEKKCRIALIRLMGELRNEYSGPQKAYKYLCERYKLSDDAESVADNQMKTCMLKLLLQMGEYQHVLDICKEYTRHVSTKYDFAIIGAYIGICESKLEKMSDFKNFDLALRYFEELKDERGISWVKGEKGLAQLKIYDEEAERNIIEAMRSKQKIKECSKEYRLWLAELNRMQVSENVASLLEKEKIRINSTLQKRFIPKELLISK